MRPVWPYDRTQRGFVGWAVVWVPDISDAGLTEDHRVTGVGCGTSDQGDTAARMLHRHFVAPLGSGTSFARTTTGHISIDGPGLVVRWDLRRSTPERPVVQQQF